MVPLCELHIQNHYSIHNYTQKSSQIPSTSIIQLKPCSLEDCNHLRSVGFTGILHYFIDSQEDLVFNLMSVVLLFWTLLQTVDLGPGETKNLCRDLHALVCKYHLH